MAAVRLGRTQTVVASHVACEHQMATGREGAMELGIHDRQQLRWRVVGGVVGEDAAEFTVLYRQFGHRPYGEAQDWECLTGQLDHFRRQVDAERGHSQL